MTRTPDEIKKGLECCSNVNFVCNEECPYYKSLSEGEDCCLKKNADALALIQQLQDDNAQLNRCIENMTDKLNAMNDEVAKLPAERDAAVCELEVVAEKVEQVDAYIDDYIHAHVDYSTYLDARDMVDSIVNWEYESEWRGVQKEE